MTKLFGDSVVANLFPGLTTKPVLTNFVVFVLASTVVIGFSTLFLYGGDFWGDLLVEGHGLLFELLLMGTLIVGLNSLGQRRLENIGLNDEIDHLRPRKIEEASYRIALTIKKLNGNGVTTDINLSKCYLVESELQNAKLNRANLVEADLSKANLVEARLLGAMLYRANLSNANLILAKLAGAFLIEANLSGADLREADLRGARGLTTDQLSQVYSLYAARLDPDLEALMRANYPHLLESPLDPRPDP